jgi:hypothetical protein
MLSDVLAISSFFFLALMTMRFLTMPEVRRTPVKSRAHPIGRYRFRFVRVSNCSLEVSPVPPR